MSPEKPGAYDIGVSVDRAFRKAVSASALRAAVVRTLASEGVHKAELGVVVTDDDALRELNREHRGLDEPTDVLSFALSEGDDATFVLPPDDTRHLGEVIVSYPTVERQAQDAGVKPTRELLHVLVHGVLHLLGHDHETPEEESAMHAREEAILASLAP